MKCGEKMNIHDKYFKKFLIVWLGQLMSAIGKWTCGFRIGCLCISEDSICHEFFFNHSFFFSKKIQALETVGQWQK